MEALANSEIWTVELTSHCVGRFRERFCPGLELRAAEERLVRLIDFARFERCAPVWLVSPEPAAAWLVVGDDLAVPLVERGSHSDVLVATTCLPRGGITRAARERRNAHRQRRATQRR